MRTCAEPDRGSTADALTLGPPHRVLVPLLLGVVGLPATGGEDVLVLLVPAPQHHLTRVRLQTAGDPGSRRERRRVNMLQNSTGEYKGVMKSYKGLVVQTLHFGIARSDSLKH